MPRSSLMRPEARANLAANGQDAFDTSNALLHSSPPWLAGPLGPLVRPGCLGLWDFVFEPARPSL